MRQMFRRLPWLLMLAGVVISTPALAAKASVRAHKCSAQPALPAGLPDPDEALDTFDKVIAAFKFARKHENCHVPLRIDRTIYNAASTRQKILLLINAERRDRGLRALKLDAILLSDIAYHHARELRTYGYSDWNPHSSPINAPNKLVQDRYLVNPILRKIRHLSAAENIGVAAEWDAAKLVYSFMYQNSGGEKPWEYRQAILGYLSPTGAPGHYNWIGIGEDSGGAFFSATYVLDFLEGQYKPPKVSVLGDRHKPPIHGNRPIMSAPIIVDSSTVEVTNVRDDQDRTVNGVAGITGVVFYIGSIGYQNGAFTTVPATATGNGTWRANLPARDLTKLHAVAVDGRGSYTDCAGGTGSCGGPGPDYLRIAPPPPDLAGPESITSGPDGNLWFTDDKANRIGRITTGGVISEFDIPTGDSEPAGISSGPDGNLWFTERRANKVGRITPLGAIAEFAVPTANAYPARITSGPDGNLWFVEPGANRIGRVTPSGVITEFAIPTADSSPSGIASGSDGNLWFTEKHTNKIGRISPAGIIREFDAPGLVLDIASGPDGNLWFTEPMVDNIGRITPSGVITEFGYAPVWKICGGPDGNLWFSEASQHKIGRITPNGVISEFDIPNAKRGNTSSIISGPDGNLWFTEANQNKIGRVTPSGVITEFDIPPSDSRPLGAANWPSGEKIGEINPN